MAENSEWKNDEEEARARKEAEAAVRHARDYHMRKQGYWKGFFVGFFACVAVLAVAAAVLFFRVSGNRRPYRADKTTQATPAEASANPKDLNYDKIEAKMRLLQNVIYKNYLFDEKETDVEDGIYKGMMSGLGDPYSVYYTADEYKKLTEETSGQYSGIGAVLNQDPDTKISRIVTVFPGSPAEEAGLKPDDILYQVAGKDVSGENLDVLVASYIRGAEGTSVEIKVLRGDKHEELTFNVTRRNIVMPTVESEMKANKIGYIRVLQFDTVTPDQFKQAVDELQKKGMKRLVIDLRNNPGGVVDSCISMLDYMLPDGLLVYTAGRDGVGEKYYATDGHEVNLPTVILINKGSASCSEIFAGAYHDFDRAKLVGTTSFGKGIVQFVMPLGDGSAVKLTTQHYYTPNGFDLHGKGVAPDVEAESEEGDVQNGEKDAQLMRALEVVQEE